MKPITARSSVVFPLPEAPRIAVSVPSGTKRSTSPRTALVPYEIAIPRQRSSATSRLPQGADLAEAGREHVRGRHRQRDEDRRERRGRGERNRRAVGLELGPERVQV